MNFSGFQKLTLLDYPGKTACTLFTAGCDFRCPFCHNPSLVLPEPTGSTAQRAEAQTPEMPPKGAFSGPGHWTEAEVLAFLQKRIGLLDGVCITGGEPLLHTDLAPFLAHVKALGFSVKLDTNGNHPTFLKQLVAQGLVDYVAMDLKNAPMQYARTIGRPIFDPDAVRQSVEFLLSDAVDYEFRTTVIRELHRKEDLLALAQGIRGARRYFLQAFVDTGNLVQDALKKNGTGTFSVSEESGETGAQHRFHAYSEAEMRMLCDAVRAVLPATEVRGL